MFGIFIQRPIDSITRSCLLMNFIIKYFEREGVPEFADLEERSEVRDIFQALGSLYVEVYGRNITELRAGYLAKLMENDDHSSLVSEFFKLNYILKQALYKYLSLDPMKRKRHLARLLRSKKLPHNAESTDLVIRKLETLWVDRTDIL